MMVLEIREATCIGPRQVETHHWRGNLFLMIPSLCTLLRHSKIKFKCVNNDA